MARKRLATLNRRFERDQELKGKYNSVLSVYEKLRFITEVTPDELAGPYPIYYLPHRAVVREDAVSSKVRPVFDASAKGYNKISLNDCLETGPSLMPDLVAILLKFTRWQVALTADVCKAFLQIGVRPEDQNVHRFLWNCNGKVRTMKFLRVTFGNRSSPFLLNATIKHHIATYPPSLVVEELSENIWVDDWLSGADTDLDTCHLFDDGCAIFSAAKMTLAKCHSNSRVLLDKFCQDSGDHHLQDDAVKVLGMKWLSIEDSFTFDGAQIPHR
ncbi:uncharacterized protein LOC135486792 [Lineus longissimus]|uniref:uncharacterized protein LOC135486792 n=1 Tax=Lineus longissimus TaxID=88925 RepID=UPI00315CC4BE